jgi:dienelactone hydrolase
MHTVLKSEAGEIPIFFLPAEEQAPVLLIFPSIFGIDEDLEELVFRLNDLGLTVVAVDPFWSVGGGPLSTAQTQRALERKRNLGTLNGIHNAILYCELIKEESVPLIALGIGYGGHLAFCAAAEQKVDGVCCWHADGLGDYAMLGEDIQVPTQLHFGANDVLVMPHEVEAIQAGFNDSSRLELWVHEGAGFNFSHRSHQSFHEPTFERVLSDLERWLRRWI